jgi:hypothetical protein
MAGKEAHKARSDTKRIGDVSLRRKWLRHSTYMDYKQCVMDDLG